MSTRGWESVKAIVSPAKPPRKAARMPQERKSKYRAIRTEVDGVTFASKAEARRYVELKLAKQLGAIQDLELQPQFVIWAFPNGYTDTIGRPVGKYVADFRYYRADGELVVEDVKGMKTPVYNLKKKLVEAQYGIQIREIR